MTKDAPEDDAVRFRELEARYADSAIHRSLALRLTVRGRGDVRVICDGTAGLAGNRNGLMGGGALATMIDSAVVQCLRTLSADSSYSTIEMKVNFLRPAPADSVLTATASVLRDGRTISVGSAEVRDARDAVIAAGIVTVAKLPRRAGEAGPEQ
jgi:uncharacterized protein (TIGR00369 family)